MRRPARAPPARRAGAGHRPGTPPTQPPRPTLPPPASPPDPHRPRVLTALAAGSRGHHRAPSVCTRQRTTPCDTQHHDPRSTPPH
ncbi:MAG: hypothetical protein C0475_05360 [Planctomyces sp.]|nr:hypothetical protein [Planctomyces sp.]